MSGILEDKIPRLKFGVKVFLAASEVYELFFEFVKQEISQMDHIYIHFMGLIN